MWHELTWKSEFADLMYKLQTEQQKKYCPNSIYLELTTSVPFYVLMLQFLNICIV